MTITPRTLSSMISPKLPADKSKLIARVIIYIAGMTKRNNIAKIESNMRKEITKTIAPTLKPIIIPKIIAKISNTPKIGSPIKRPNSVSIITRTAVIIHPIIGIIMVNSAPTTITPKNNNIMIAIIKSTIAYIEKNTIKKTTKAMTMDMIGSERKARIITVPIIKELITPPTLSSSIKAKESTFIMLVKRDIANVSSPVGNAARFANVDCNLNPSVTIPNNKKINPVKKNTIGAASVRAKKKIPERTNSNVTEIRSMISMTIRTADRAMFMSASSRLAMAMPPTPDVYARFTIPITVV
jgi:hypothetical protein